MKAWKIIAIAGGILILLSLVFLFASSSTISSALNTAITRMKSIPPKSLMPNENLTFSVSSLSYLLYNSSAPLELLQNNKSVTQFEITNYTWVAVISPNLNVFIINNYSSTMLVRYVTETVSPLVYLIAFSPYLLFIGILVLIFAFILFIFRKK
ncbi:MAG: hypothetical protein JZD40_07100 [Sulfolobus sp.]|nr:hypothetical protein [Sulfolobus sp.]